MEILTRGYAVCPVVQARYRRSRFGRLAVGEKFAGGHPVRLQRISDRSLSPRTERASISVRFVVGGFLPSVIRTIRTFPPKFLTGAVRDVIGPQMGVFLQMPLICYIGVARG